MSAPGMPEDTDVHAAWLGPEAFRAVGSRRIAVFGGGLLIETGRREVEQAFCRLRGGRGGGGGQGTEGDADLVLALCSWPELPPAAEALRDAAPVDPEGFVLARQHGVTV